MGVAPGARAGPGKFRPLDSALRLRAGAALCAARGAWLGWDCRATTGRFMVWSRMTMRFWNSASVALHATLNRMPAAMVFHVCVISGCCVILNLPVALLVGEALQRKTQSATHWRTW
jgi:hypothetical protein